MAGWLSENEAARISRRSTRTIRSWRRAGLVRWRRVGGRVMIDQGSVYTAIARARQRQEGYELRKPPRCAGPGRGRRDSNPLVDPVLF